MQRKTLFFFLVILLAAGITPGFLFGQTLNLDYSTYLGGSNDDYGSGISLGTDGRIYVTGYTESLDFPTENPYQASYGGGLLIDYDAFVSVLTSTGSAISYSTYLGGIGDDYGSRINVGTDGMAYVIGRTESSDFPTINSYQARRAGDYDAFVSALSSTGSALYYSTYLGGTGFDYGLGISLGTDGTAYVTGYTDSSSFPLQNPYQTNRPGYDVFVSALSPTGSALSYSTYLGGSGDEHGNAISVGTDGTAYVTGYTRSSDFPTVNPYQAEPGGGYNDVFVTALSSSGAALSYSTYLGGSGYDLSKGISLGTDGSAYVTGITGSSDFPMENPYQSVYGGGTYDAFVSALSSTGSALSYSSYLGGSLLDQGRGISLGADGTAYVTGETESSDFPTENPYQAEYGGGTRDAFVSALSSTGSALSYSTYLGGSNNDYGTEICLGPDSAAYVTGYTYSFDFPTKNPYQAEPGGGSFCDVFVSMLILGGPPVPPWIHDYNGDGTSDIAIFRGTSGLWAIRGVTRVYFGESTDEAVPGDYNGDGTTEIGIFRPASGLWAIKSTTRAYFGSGSDLPEPGDYNGDGTADIGIFRETSGLWAIRGITRVYFGSSVDSPVPGYYDGGTTKEIGIFREASGLWAIRGISRIYFGSTGDAIVPGDYDGDGAWDYGIYRGSSGLWAIRNVTRNYFGSSSDSPVPGDYDGSGTDDIGIFRAGSGLWAVKSLTRAYYGSSGDIPVTR